MKRWAGTLTHAERFIALDGRPFRREDWPMMIEPAAALDSGMGKTTILMMPPQRGKTLLAQLRVLRNLAIEPRRQLWYSKTATDARSVSDTKLKPLLESTPSVQWTRYTDPDKRGRNMMFRFHNAPLEMLSADVVAHRNSRSAREIVMDEAWQYQPRAIAEIMMRADSFDFLRQAVIPTTAPDKGHDLDVLWETSTRHDWQMVCPHCSSVFVPDWSDRILEWDRITDESGRYQVEPSAQTCRMIPPCCQVPIHWSLEIQRKMNDRARGAGYIQRNPTPNPSVVGYRFNSLATDDWRQVCALWLQAQNALRNGDSELLREFIIKRAMQPYDSSRQARVMDKPIEVGPYILGAPWPDEAIDANGNPWRFATIDVQRNHFWGIVRQWSADGRSRLVARAKLLTRQEVQQFCADNGVLHGQWMEERLPFGELVLTADSRVFLDSKYHTSEVLEICAQYGFHCVNSYKRNAFKHNDGTWHMHDEGRLLDPFSGKKYDGIPKRVRQWFFVADAAKDRMEILRSTTGPDDLPMWTASEDCGDEYKAQMAAEAKVKVFGADNVSFEWRWKRIQSDNHYFDCETMQILAATMAGFLNAEAVNK
jgi:hypothetical protein